MELTGSEETKANESVEGLVPPLPEPAPAKTRVTFGGLSHPGRVRDNNEDHFLIARIARTLDLVETNLPEEEVPGRFEECGYAMVVADGMGGMAAGEVASRLALKAGVHLVLNDLQWGLQIDDGKARELTAKMIRHFRTVNAALAEHARGDSALEGMGTTLTLAYSVGPDLFLVHVGDSRAYLFRGGRLTQLTRDQTLAQMLADAGEISVEELASHKFRHVLTSAVGGAGEMAVETRQLRLRDGDCLLLCSDGLSDLVSDAAIAEVLAGTEDPRQACRELVDRALEAGGRDNVTVVLAQYALPG
jgi:serine/threonine protein phosphatase PrpC